MERKPEAVELLGPEAGPYRIRLWFGDIDRRPGIVGVEMWGIEPPAERHRPFMERRKRRDTGPGVDDFETEPADPLPETPVTAVSIRLPLGKLLDEWVERNRAFARAATKLGADPVAVEAFLRRVDEPRKAGRPPLNDEFLQTVANAYRAAEAAGDRAPAKAVARHLLSRGDSIKPVTVRSWIKAARRRGLLQPAKPRERAAAPLPEATRTRRKS